MATNTITTFTGGKTLRLEVSEICLAIQPEDTGTANMAEGYGYPVTLEYYEGRWVLHVWADINREEPTHKIDLTGALESQRER